MVYSLKILRLFFMTGLLGMVFLLMGCNGFLERIAVCFPQKGHDGRPEDFRLTARDLFFETKDRVRLHGWLFSADFKGPYLLWCHGNAGNISHRLENIALLLKKGINVFIFDYRGYGKSEGTVSEQGFYRDARAAWDCLLKEGSTTPSQIVLFGRSLGCAVAVDLALQVPAAGLILESGFPHLGTMARYHYPFVLSEKFLSGRYDALSKITRVKMPVLVVHGTKDSIVPISLGRRLFQAAPEPKSFYEIPGADHNDTYIIGGEAYFQMIREAIRKWTASKSL
jgi:fermentation-respiration switch protein FrsA (DUF1100 family)